MSCPDNLTNPRDLFTPLRLWEEGQRRRRARLLREYLPTLAAPVRAHVLAELRPDLRALRLSEEDFEV